MPSYLVQVSYTQSALSAMVQHPEDRAEAIRKPIENLGGKIGPFWFSFGDYDVVGITEMPNNVSAAAFALAIGAGGACKNVKTTPLLTTEDAMEAMKNAATCGYKPVGVK
jgi:uncharacterized protein with GYD domain